MMITDETARALFDYSAFVAEAHKLANSLHMQDNDARETLVRELLEHRFAVYSDSDIRTCIAADDMVFNYRIKYARRDIVRRHYRALGQDRNKVNTLAPLTTGMYVIESPTPNMRVKERLQVDEACELAPLIFKSPKTKRFVTTVLQYGQVETCARLHLTRQQFTARMDTAIGYCRRHRERIDGLLSNQQDEAIIDEHNQLSVLDALLQSQHLDKDDVQQWITANRDYVEDVVGQLIGVRHQGSLINDYAHAQLHDRYKLINALQQRLDVIEQTIMSEV